MENECVDCYLQSLEAGLPTVTPKYYVQWFSSIPPSLWPRMDHAVVSIEFQRLGRSLVWRLFRGIGFYDIMIHFTGAYDFHIATINIGSYFTVLHSYYR